MPPRFDPLHKWLGIPPGEQPPHAYRLLAIVLFEDDPDVIANAADQRMLFIKSLSSGPNATIGEGLLNQVAAARLCLLNPAKKGAYDVALRQYLAGQKSPTGAQPPPPPAPDAGALFGQFTLFERIGGDTYGPIFKAKSRKNGTLVSLKILPPQVAKDERLVKRFEREVSLMAKLRHPNVVGGVGVGDQDGVHYLVLEYVDGVDLAEILHRVGPPDIYKTVGYMIQAATGLQYLHENHVYHRNVKPGNLLVDRSGTVKVANLLMAHVVEARSLDGEDGLTRTGEMLGTVDYVAPEQASDASTADERADIYSLGCTMFHLLAGRPPYTGKNMMDKLIAHREAPIPSLAAVRQDLPNGLDRVVTRMLAKKRTERQQSMNEVVAALKPFATPGKAGGFWSRLTGK